MSKHVKNLIMNEIAGVLGKIDGIAIVNPKGMDGVKNNNLRRKLHASGLKMKVVRNSLARKASQGTKVFGFDAMLDGPTALVYGANVSISTLARTLVDARKDNEKLELRGVFFDGSVYAGEKGVETVSKFPTREEAIAGILGAILGPGSSVGAALVGPGGTLGGLLSTIEEKNKDKQ